MSDDQSTWRELIEAEMAVHGETWADVVRCSLDDAGLDRSFDCGYGITHGEPFTLWTTARVYFPAQYDGAEWVASVPREPCDEVSHHVGGGG